jgi:hypothetical protein
MALALAGVLTGIDLRTARQRRQVTGSVGRTERDGPERPATTA